MKLRVPPITTLVFWKRQYLTACVCQGVCRNGVTLQVGVAVGHLHHHHSFPAFLRCVTDQALHRRGRVSLNRGLSELRTVRSLRRSRSSPCHTQSIHDGSGLKQRQLGQFTWHRPKPELTDDAVTTSSNSKNNYAYVYQ